MAYDIIPTTVIGNELIVLATATDLQNKYKKMPINAVKSADTIIAISEITPDNAGNGVLHNYPATMNVRNKANINYDSLGTISGDVVHKVLIPDTLIEAEIDNTNFSEYVDNGSDQQWIAIDGITLKKKGYICFWVNVGIDTGVTKQTLLIITDGTVQIRLTFSCLGAEYGYSFKIDTKYADEAWELEILELTTVNENDIFMCLSWENIMSATIATSYIKVQLQALILYTVGDYAGKWRYFNEVENTSMGYAISETDDMSMRLFTTLDSGSGYLYLSQLSVVMDKVISGIHKLFALSRQYPVYPDDPIGIDYETTQLIPAVTGDAYFVNNNIKFERFTAPEQDDRPGRIIWTNLNNIISTNEFTINHNITAVKTAKSQQQTDEHNTLLVWANNEIKIMTFLNDIPEIIDTRMNIGITNKYSLVNIPDGFAWVAPEGIWIMRNNQPSLITRTRIDIDRTSVITCLCYDQTTNSLYIIQDDGMSYIYCIDNDAFFEMETDNMPTGLSDFFIHRDIKLIAASDGTTDSIYKDSTTDMVATVTLQDINIIKSVLLRIIDKTNLPSTITSFDAVVYNAEGNNDSIDQITTMTTNKNYQVPGLKGTPVQITFVPTTAIDAIEVIEK